MLDLVHINLHVVALIFSVDVVCPSHRHYLVDKRLVHLVSQQSVAEDEQLAPVEPFAQILLWIYKNEEILNVFRVH